MFYFGVSSLVSSVLFCFFFLMRRRPPRSTRTDTLFPSTTLFRSTASAVAGQPLWRQQAHGRNDPARLCPRLWPAFGVAAVFQCRRREFLRRHRRGPPYREPPCATDPGGGSGAACSPVALRGGLSDPGRYLPARLCPRTEERRVGNSCVSTVRSRGGPDH